MEHGKIVQIGTAEEVMNQPADELIASFVGTGTVLTGRVVQAANHAFRVSVGDKEIEAAGDFQPGDSVALLIRPEYVTISIPPDGHASSARNVFAGTVSRITLMGFYQKVRETHEKA
jgi:ABC-type Fe3+/spermidine/putrescine transport system ATPase subunit